VLDVTEVAPATTLLDLGCGDGRFARAAADRGAQVTGVDLDLNAVERAAVAVPEATFFVRDAQDPPPGPFDVVVAMQLLMHVADPVAVLGRAGRVGGVLAATVWGREEECAIRAFGEALAQWLGPRPPSGPSITEPARLRAVTEEAGLVVERVDEVVCPFDYADEDELLGPLFDSAIGRAVGRRAGPVALREAVLERLEPYRTGPVGYRLENVFRVLVARRPT
jgi:SAM-dependent methyltransferase